MELSKADTKNIKTAAWWFEERQLFESSNLHLICKYFRTKWIYVIAMFKNIYTDDALVNALHLQSKMLTEIWWMIV